MAGETTLLSGCGRWILATWKPYATLLVLLALIAKFADSHARAPIVPLSLLLLPAASWLG